MTDSRFPYAQVVGGVLAKVAPVFFPSRVSIDSREEVESPDTGAIRPVWTRISGFSAVPAVIGNPGENTTPMVASKLMGVVRDTDCLLPFYTDVIHAGDRVIDDKSINYSVVDIAWDVARVTTTLALNFAEEHGVEHA